MFDENFVLLLFQGVRFRNYKKIQSIQFKLQLYVRSWHIYGNKKICRTRGTTSLKITTITKDVRELISFLNESFVLLAHVTKNLKCNSNPHYNGSRVSVTGMRFHANPLTARRGAVQRRARSTARGSTRSVGAGLCVFTLLFVFCVSCCSHLFQSNTSDRKLATKLFIRAV